MKYVTYIVINSYKTIRNVNVGQQGLLNANNETNKNKVKPKSRKRLGKYKHQLIYKSKQYLG